MNRKLKELFNGRKNVVYSVIGNTTIKQAVDTMNIHHIGALIVVAEDGSIEGIVTERDVMKKLASTNDLIGHVHVSDIMTPKENMIVISGDETIADIMKTMVDNKVRHLPIVDDEGNLVNIVAIQDILQMLLKDARIEAKDLKNYVSGKYPL